VKTFWIDQFIDPFAHGEPALVALPLDLVDAAHLAREGFAAGELVKFRLPAHSDAPFFSKLPLADEATLRNLRSQPRSTVLKMPEIRIVTEVAGRVCTLPVQAGASVGKGDDVAFVEAMKMEIPVASPAAGRIKLILVNLDDVVAEGQTLVILEA
jgi:biotin carboxyl carrier protein